MLRSILLKMAENKRMEAFVRGGRFSRGTVSRFVAGESVDQTIEPVRELNKAGITISLDFLGESVHSKEEVDATIRTYLELFEKIEAHVLNANVSIKLTALGLDIDQEFCYKNMVVLLEAAGPSQFIRIDMESTAYTQITLDLFYRLWNEGGYRNVGVVIQAYLRRSEADVEELIKNKVRVRLCKGAYKEPADLAFPAKADVDANYIKLMKRLLSDGNYPGIATHDPKMIAATCEWAKQQSIPSDRYEFQMLYGIRRDLQMQLIKDGYRMRVYTPFGTHWYPYFMRRLAERPANLWFVLKNMLNS